MEGIDQHDWEDITMLEYNGVDYIYVGDIGNNYDGHCRGINYEDMAIYRFPEPELSRYMYVFLWIHRTYRGAVGTMYLFQVLLSELQ